MAKIYGRLAGCSPGWSRAVPPCSSLLRQQKKSKQKGEKQFVHCVAITELYFQYVFAAGVLVGVSIQFRKSAADVETVLLVSLQEEIALVNVQVSAPLDWLPPVPRRLTCERDADPPGTSLDTT